MQLLMQQASFLSDFLWLFKNNYRNFNSKFYFSQNSFFSIFFSKLLLDIMYYLVPIKMPDFNCCNCSTIRSQQKNFRLLTKCNSLRAAAAAAHQLRIQSWFNRPKQHSSHIYTYKMDWVMFRLLSFSWLDEQRNDVKYIMDVMNHYHWHFSSGEVQLSL